MAGEVGLGLVIEASSGARAGEGVGVAGEELGGGGGRGRESVPAGMSRLAIFPARRLTSAGGKSS